MPGAPNHAGGRISVSGNVSLTPGFSPVMSERLRSEPFQRLGRGASPQSCRKRLKPFRFLPAANTRMKPGVNGTRIQLQEIEMRPSPAKRQRAGTRNLQRGQSRPLVESRSKQCFNPGGAADSFSRNKALEGRSWHWEHTPLACGWRRRAANLVPPFSQTRP